MRKKETKLRLQKCMRLCKQKVEDVRERFLHTPTETRLNVKNTSYTRI